VRALTGTDPDRLPEEKARGITIDLGFAHVELGEGVVASFVDVPGHERFVRNMLAGAHGIDAVLLVVAADESVMPQTREHFDICRLLGVPRGLVALTKCDVADDTSQALAAQETEALVAGSFLEGATVLRVSARTGEGLPELRSALLALAQAAARRPEQGLLRLPIDRVFTVKGFGTVVTGTLVAGTLSVGDEVLALPYGDVDIAGAADSDPGIIRLARERSGREIPELRVITSPVVAAPEGYLDMAAIGLVPRGTTVLLSDRMLGVGAPTVAQVYGHRAVLASTRVTAGGPGPDDPAGPVALRQRLLSEAALGVLADRESLVAAFLGYEDLALSPAGASEFFAGLDVDWLRLTTLRAVSREAGEVEQNTDPAYPEAAADAELPGANFVAARGLINAGDRLDALLPDNDTVGRQVLDEALAGVSYAVRPIPVEGAATAERSTAAIGSLMRRVSIEAPPSVTLSSDTGTFSATLSNGLDEVVLVRVQADTDEGLEIEPSEPVELGPEEQATVLMEAHSSVLGIHEVDLTVTDAEGNPVGGQASFPLRAAQVSDVIWIVWAVGAGLLFGAIAVRLFRRIRGHAAGRKAHP
jgi:signal recognition particle receptor subunit beta